MVMESMAEKFDTMHNNLKRNMSNQIAEIKSMKVKLALRCDSGAKQQPL